MDGTQRGEQKKDDLLQQKDDVQAKYARLLFVRCDALEVRHPVVILQNDKANVYHVLEKHFRPEYLAGQERYWKNLREMYNPRLETWRPRVNGVQLKVLQGARLPECEAEWAALDAALSRLAPYLRSDSGVAVLCRELRDFVGLLDGWWANRKRGEGGPSNNKRQAAASLALPINKRQSLEFMQHGLMGPIFVQPEIISHSLLGPPLIFAHGTDGGAVMEASDLLVPQAPAAAAAAAATVEAAWVGGEAPQQLASPGSRLLHRQPSRQQAYMMELMGSGGGDMGKHAAAGVQGGRREEQQPGGVMPGTAADHAGALAGLHGSGCLDQSAPFRPATCLQGPAGMMEPAGVVGLAGGCPAEDMTPRHPYQHQHHQHHHHHQQHQVQQHQHQVQQHQQQVNHHATAAMSSVHPLDHDCSPQHRQHGGYGEEGEGEQQGRERALQPGLGAEDRLGSGPLSSMDPAEQAAAGAAAAAANAAAQQPQPPQLDKLFVALNVGGHRFLTTAATLAVVEGSFLWRLARQCAKAGATGTTPEFFIDRSGKLFEYVLDYLRSARFAERDSCLPREERALALVRREAEFYQLPELAERAAAALEQLHGHGQAGGLGSPRTGGNGGASERTAACGGGEGSRGCGAGREAANVALDSLFLETGLQPGNSLGLAKAALMQQLNSALQAKQAEGYVVAKQECGAEREGQMRNLFYHIVLRKQL